MKHVSLQFNKLLLFLLASLSILAVSCDKEGDDEVAAGPPVISSVRAADSTNRDSTFTTSLTGKYIIIQGQNFKGLTNIFINDQPVPFTSTYVTNTNIVLQIPSNIVTEATNPAVSNKMRIVTPKGEAVYDFKLVPPPPSVRSISNEMALPGEVVTIRGTDFFGIEKVIFPGNLEGTNLTVVDTATIRVTVPAGLTETGTVQVVSKYGTGFNQNIEFGNTHHTGMVANFEDGDPKFGWAWWGGIKSNDASKFPGNRGNYIQVNPNGGVPAGNNSWWENNRAVNMNNNPLVPDNVLSDAVSNYALKFEMNMPTAWKNGTLLMRVGGDGGPYRYRYTPWKTAANNTFKTEGW
ncbi:MAG TPA: glycan-binding surface protein, partial [Chitinophagaceae bacterium]|nr:glycan-binding surface protein [Chitinophagaceae bacterium]